MSRLEARDLEVLRTLARLYFVSSAQLNGTFFPSETVCYRRLRSLAARDFIKRHTKGAPPRSSYCAWRLTALGIGTVRDEFGEDIPEGLDERLANQSLVDHDHREAISSVYLGLIGGEAAHTEETSWQELQLRMAMIQGRAERVRWQADGALVLRYRDFREEHRLVPDATIEPVSKPYRLFMELDRSNKPLGRIEENLQRYGAFVRGPYRTLYPDGRKPWVVYVVRSQHRGSNVAKLAGDILGRDCHWKIATYTEAVPWLAELLLDEHREMPSAPAFKLPPGDAAAADGARALRAAAHDLLRSTSDLLKRSTDTFDALGQQQPELISHWKRDLRALYELLREGAHGR